METCRAGDLIPKVGNVDLLQRPEKDVPFTFPALCPECSSDLALDGPSPRCTGGLGCAAQVRKRLQHLVSREALNIDGFSPAQIDVYWDRAALPIRTPVDIFARHERDMDGVLASSPATALSMRRGRPSSTTLTSPQDQSPQDRHPSRITLRSVCDFHRIPTDEPVQRSASHPKIPIHILRKNNTGRPATPPDGIILGRRWWLREAST